jgi:non-specific serine/threonine protein kinase
MRRGDLTQARPYLEESITICKALGESADKWVYCEALNILGMVVGRHEGTMARRSLNEEALEIAREMGDNWSIARSLYQLGHVGRMSGDNVLATSMYEKSLELFRESGDTLNVALALIGLGQMAERRSDYESARRYYEESLAKHREVGDKWGISSSLWCLGCVALYQGNYPRARTYLEENLAMSRELGAPGSLAETFLNLGRIAYFQGDYAQAHSMYEQCLALFQVSGDKFVTALSLMDMGGVKIAALPSVRHIKAQSSLQGRERRAMAARAARLQGAAQALLSSMGVQLNPLSRELSNSYIAATRAQLGEESFEAAWEEGRAMSMEEAIAYAQHSPSNPYHPIPGTHERSPLRVIKLRFGGLTRREREVAALVAQGKSNREIADHLVVSERTVEGHVSKILSKLGFQARSEVSAWAIEKGLTERFNS